MHLGEVIQLKPIAAPISNRIPFTVGPEGSGGSFPAPRALGTDRWNNWSAAFWAPLNSGLYHALADRT